MDRVYTYKAIKWAGMLYKVIVFAIQQIAICGWLGRAMVLGSFKCRGVILLWHMVGQGPAVLAAGAVRVGFFFFFFNSFILSSFPDASSLWRRLDILEYCCLGRYNPTVVVSYYWRRAG